MEQGTAGLNGERILIVDDVETNRLVLEEIIKDMGCSPVLAENGEQALQMAKECLPKLILTDISMPGIEAPSGDRSYSDHLHFGI